MRWLQIARKDFDDARRDRQLYYLLGILSLFALGIGYIVGDNPEFVSPGQTAMFLLSVFAILAPIVALTISQADIVGKRATGELSVLLSLPFSRRTIVLGSLVGRMAVMTVVLVAVFVLAPLVVSVRGAPVDPVALAGAFGMIWLLSLVFTAIALGISTFTRSTTLSAGGSFGVFLLFVMQLWTVIPIGIRYLINGLTMPSGPQPEWAAVFVQLSPFAALRNLAEPVFSEIVGSVPLAAGEVGESLPWYHEPVFAAIVVVAWIVLPLAAGYWRFQTTDL
ncbi:ABC-type transport system involved in multi-copper enzyme maturation, permease component [Halorhabdus sp. SVX81]|uniref:ABC transporter permease n=1 Tax=Halorhabdus sp. SVX81 TaxID=2978283 RepID=UPI0023DB6895|nr:ABC transporter permease subunit [Halorhabdus sp. SVX81]WEL17150.1 ABC-type transport system involved in multi-copper enzyme maturation, permease component [Halorhabdus sp. SVX81]